MQIKIPSAALGAVKTAAGAPNVTTQQLQMQVQQLEQRVALLESALHVDVQGNVEIYAGKDLYLSSASRIQIEAASKLKLAASGSVVELSGGGLEVSTPGTLKLASAAFRSVAGTTNFDTGMANFSGVVKCDTIQANTVIGASYTPGAGNVW